MRIMSLAFLTLAACTPTREVPDVAAAPSADASGDGQLAETAGDAVVPGADSAGLDSSADGDTGDAATLPDVASVSDVSEVPDVVLDISAVPDVVQDVGAVADVSDVAEVAPDAGSGTDSSGSVDAVGDADVSALDVPGGATNVDLIGVDWSCTDPGWIPSSCVDGVTTAPVQLPGQHIDLPTAITYADLPPSSGPHRPMWGKFGEFSFLPQQRWLHNLEHGAEAFLYNPCAPKTTVDALRALAKSIAPDDSGPFRYVLTPYPKLPSAIAIVTWGHVYTAQCVMPVQAKAFILANYRKAPEDEDAPGWYDILWLGPWP